MKSRHALAAAALALVVHAGAAHATVPVVFGSSWDALSLQSILDATYGTGRVNVAGDYIGAHNGDEDPWFWVDVEFSSLLVREVAGNANNNLVGWYLENGAKPVIDGVGDGVVFDGPSSAGATRLITFDRPLTKFGFYLDPNGDYDAQNAPQGEYFFTNRLWNDRGTTGPVALHAPFDGDVQALVFDISGIVGLANTWLVCFEDLDSGAQPKGCCVGTDNDYNDLVFEVHALGATPVVPITFGALKRMYR